MNYLPAYTFAMALMILIIIDSLVADARLGIWHVFEILLIVFVIGLVGWWWLKKINGIIG